MPTKPSHVPITVEPSAKIKAHDTKLALTGKAASPLALSAPLITKLNTRANSKTMDNQSKR
jgi:hypothetical protein